MSENSRWAVILCGVFGSLTLLTNPAVTRAQALLPPPAQQPSVSSPSPSIPAPSPPPAPSAEPEPIYPQTADGFTAEFTQALKAYQNGDAAAARRLLEQFRLHRSAEWLLEYLGPAQNEALARRYDREFETYLKSIDARLSNLGNNKLNISFNPAAQALPNPARLNGPLKLSGIVTLKDPAGFNAHFSARLTGKADLVLKGNFKSVSWEDCFVYQDGAFRFIGAGAWPFWVWQDRFDEKSTQAP